MDPITAAALAAMAGGVGGEAGRHAWQGLSALVRRPFRRGGTEGADGTEGAGGADDVVAVGVSSGEPELVALEEAPTDPARAQVLATALGVRAALDSSFARLLDEWWQQARAADAGGTTHNHIGGGTQSGEVFQGRDFSHVTLTVHRTAPPSAS
ncbi:hypothetical protein ACWEPZ_07035 [Streptomyces sp. NPDC004288]|uniref:hypothetical protein n=1 Tax=Streptomyces sp. NPDC091368 TaxID=3365993 RepID=UPI0037F66081